MNTSQSCCTPATVDRKEDTRYYTPRYQVSPSGEATEVRVELPGIGKDNLQLSLENRELRIEATASIDRPESWKPLHRESYDRSYRLRLRLGKQVNQSDISADLKDGVLILSVPNAEEAKPKTIKVK